MSLPLEKQLQHQLFEVKVSDLANVGEARELLADHVRLYFTERTDGAHRLGKAWGMTHETPLDIQLSRAGVQQYFLETIPRMSLNQCQEMLLHIHRQRLAQEHLISELSCQPWKLGGSLEDFDMPAHSEPLEIDDSSNEWG